MHHFNRYNNLVEFLAKSDYDVKSAILLSDYYLAKDNITNEFVIGKLHQNKDKTYSVDESFTIRFYKTIEAATAALPKIASYRRQQ